MPKLIVVEKVLVVVIVYPYIGQFRRAFEKLNAPFEGQIQSSR